MSPRQLYHFARCGAPKDEVYFHVHTLATRIAALARGDEIRIEFANTCRERTPAGPALKLTFVAPDGRSRHGGYVYRQGFLDSLPDRLRRALMATSIKSDDGACERAAA